MLSSRTYVIRKELSMYTVRLSDDEQPFLLGFSKREDALDARRWFTTQYDRSAIWPQKAVRLEDSLMLHPPAASITSDGDNPAGSLGIATVSLETLVGFGASLRLAMIEGVVPGDESILLRLSDLIEVRLGADDFRDRLEGGL